MIVPKGDFSQIAKLIGRKFQKPLRSTLHRLLKLNLKLKLKLATFIITRKVDSFCKHHHNNFFLHNFIWQLLNLLIQLTNSNNKLELSLAKLSTDLRQVLKCNCTLTSEAWSWSLRLKFEVEVAVWSWSCSLKLKFQVKV